ncbi:hypothetical protein O9992_19535 [Vibrio lentus]|nr:hypothetical protein [Vibrio lentus]
MHLLSGISIKAAPVKRAILGAVLPLIRCQGSTTSWVTFGSYTPILKSCAAKARPQRQYITSSAGDQEVSKGMAIKYQGVTVAEVTAIPNFNKGGGRNLHANFAFYQNTWSKTAAANNFLVSRTGDRPKRYQNVSALLSKHINVEPGT